MKKTILTFAAIPVIAYDPALGWNFAAFANVFLLHIT